MAKKRDWHGCYGENWKGVIIDDAFSHPAKYGRGLIRRIYQHAVTQGWLQEGDAVIDPFGGVALGALHAMRHGLHWHGVELETKFVDLGGRNLELWEQTYAPHMPRWGSAVLIQGDSRELQGVLAEAAISSPPYAGSVNASSHGIDWSKTGPATGNRKRGEGTKMEQTLRAQLAYPNSEGQLGAMPEGNHAACISSPPYTASLASDDPDKRGGLFRDPRRRADLSLTAEYGESPGQLGAMIEGEYGAAVSSPPWERGAEGGLRKEKFKDPEAFARRMSEGDGKGTRNGTTPASRMAQMERDAERTYGESPGQLGIETGDTFWSASRLIVEQVYRALRPGGTAIWVTKAFVRNGKRVDFPGQWRDLGEAVGFETIEWIRAWLVVENGATRDLFSGEVIEHKKQYKSFFRRLAEKNGAPPIDYEVVIVQRKPHRARGERRERGYGSYSLTVEQMASEKTGTAQVTDRGGNGSEIDKGKGNGHEAAALEGLPLFMEST